MPCLLSLTLSTYQTIRLFEYAANYYDLNTFQDGETKRALVRVANKRAGKATGRVDEPSSKRATKKQRT